MSWKPKLPSSANRRRRCENEQGQYLRKYLGFQRKRTGSPRGVYFRGWRLSDSEGALWDWFWKNQDRIRSMMEKDTE